MRRPRIPAAGRRSHRVRFEQKADAATAYVSDAGTWQTIATVWCSIRTGRAAGDGEQEIADAARGLETVQIHCEYASDLAGLDTSARAINARTGEAYNIRHVENVGLENVRLIITAEKGSPDG